MTQPNVIFKKFITFNYIRIHFTAQNTSFPSLLNGFLRSRKQITHHINLKMHQTASAYNAQQNGIHSPR